MANAQTIFKMESFADCTDGNRSLSQKPLGKTHRELENFEIVN
jgi:hypothetical protein